MSIFAMPVNNKTKDILKIARDVLGAKIALAKKDNSGAIAHAAGRGDGPGTLKYDEPADWFFPVRESLGAALLMNGDAAGAEKVFREDLDRNPRNPRSLFGLQQALKAQKRDYDAGFVQKQIPGIMEGRHRAVEGRRPGVAAAVVWADTLRPLRAAADAFEVDVILIFGASQPYPPRIPPGTGSRSECGAGALAREGRQ